MTRAVHRPCEDEDEDEGDLDFEDEELEPDEALFIDFPQHASHLVYDGVNSYNCSLNPHGKHLQRTLFQPFCSQACELGCPSLLSG